MIRISTKGRKVSQNLCMNEENIAPVNISIFLFPDWKVPNFIYLKWEYTLHSTVFKVRTSSTAKHSYLKYFHIETWECPPFLKVNINQYWVNNKNTKLLFPCLPPWLGHVASEDNNLIHQLHRCVFYFVM